MYFVLCVTQSIFFLLCCALMISLTKRPPAGNWTYRSVGALQAIGPIRSVFQLLPNYCHLFAQGLRALLGEILAGSSSQQQVDGLRSACEAIEATESKYRYDMALRFHSKADLVICTRITHRCTVCMFCAQPLV
jgi:hypothetical protein